MTVAWIHAFVTYRRMRRRRGYLNRVSSCRTFLSLTSAPPTPFPALRWCRSDSPTILSSIIRLVVLLLARVLFPTFPLFSFLVRRVSSSVASCLKVKSCARSQLACSETQLRITMESKTEETSSKSRARRWKDMKMKGAKENENENSKMNMQLQVLINRQTCK